MGVAERSYSTDPSLHGDPHPLWPGGSSVLAARSEDIAVC